MSKKVLYGLVGLVIIALLGSWWYFGTLNTAKQERNSAETRQVELTQSTSTLLEITRGSFVELDRLHSGDGEVAVFKDGDNVIVELQDDFRVDSGPDLFVWLVSEQELGGSIGGVDTNEDTFLELGPLNQFEGKQAFEVTAAEFAKHDYAVVIWCKAFGVQFTNAVL